MAIHIAVNLIEAGGIFYVLYRTNKTLAYVAAVPLAFVTVMASISGAEGGYLHTFFGLGKNRQ